MKSTIDKSVLVAIYNHPDQYPPTRNAVSVLSKKFQKVYLLYRPNSQVANDFDSNVIETQWATLEPKNPSTLQKLLQFKSFTFKIRKIILEQQPDVVIVHDNLALYSLHLVLKFTTVQSLLWYHNHDIPQITNIRKYSIGWWAAKVDNSVFPKLHLFTLPTNERLKFFPIELLSCSPLVIPNYPLKSYVERFKRPLKTHDQLRIIYQGEITFSHGILEIIAILKEKKINGKSIHLTLIGNIDKDFEIELHKSITSFNAEDAVTIKPRVPYSDLIKETVKHHIGLAAITPTGINYETAGTASNKIYEYASCGLAVLYYNSQHYEKYLGKYSWAFGSNLSKEALIQSLEKIMSDYESHATAAVKDFQESLHFEHAFLNALDKLNDIQAIRINQHEL